MSSAEGRRLAGGLLHANPDRSLRDVARSTGLAPSTVLDVRRRLQAVQDPVPPRHRSEDRRRATAQADAGARQDPPATLDDWAAGIRNLRNDPSLCFSEVGRILLRWLSGGPIKSDDRSRVVNRLPPHCLDLVAALARRHVQAWHLLVEDLEARVGRTSVGGVPAREAPQRTVVTVLRNVDELPLGRRLAGPIRRFKRPPFHDRPSCLGHTARRR